MAPVTLSYLNFPFPSPTNPSLLFIVFFVDSYRIFFLSYPVFFFNTYSPANKLSLIPICCCTGPYSTPQLPPPGRMKIWASSLPSVYEHLAAQHQQDLKQIFTFSQLPPSASYYYGHSHIQLIMCLYDAHHLESLPKSSNRVIQPYDFFSLQNIATIQLLHSNLALAGTPLPPSNPSWMLLKTWVSGCFPGGQYPSTLFSMLHKLHVFIFKALLTLLLLLLISLASITRLSSSS